MTTSSPDAAVSSTVFEIHRQYKTSTATVLAWLRDNGAAGPQSGLNINQLQRAAENARDKNIPVPGLIYHAFRDSVAKRREVTSFFTSAELRGEGKTSKTTEEHVHFTEQLQKAFTTLCPNSRGALSRRPPRKLEEELTTEQLDNRFGILQIDSDASQKDGGEEKQDTILPQPQTKLHTGNAQSPDIPSLEGDPFDALIRIHMVLRELDSICELVKSFWEEASDESLPLIIAAWLTNAAYEAAKRLCYDIIDVDKDAQEHQDVYIGIVNQLRIVFGRCPIECRYDDFTQGRGMTFPWIAIAHFKLEWRAKDLEKVHASNQRQEPVQFICPAYDDEEDKGDYFKKDIDTYNAILFSIGRLWLDEKSGKPERGFKNTDINPLMPDLVEYLEGGDDNPPLNLVFGLHLLLEVYRSFLWKAEKSNQTNCRLKALRFASQMKDMVQGTPLLSRDSIVRRMQNEDTAYLNTYLAEKCFDLYYQCPWTAGFHMCEIMHHSIDAGCRLFNSEGRVGAVLHMYNALRQLDFLEKVPLLDDLCELFRREIFLGSLPTESFSSHFRRYLGGSVQAVDSMFPDARQARLAIGLPERLPSGAGDARRLMPDKMSLFYELHNVRFSMSEDFWCRLYAGKPTAMLSKSQIAAVSEQVDSQLYTNHLTRMKAVGIDEFAGRLPVAGIKYYPIYVLCLQILTDMSTLYLEVIDKPVGLASPEEGFTFVETLLVAIVDHQRSAQMSKLLPNLVSLHMARKAIRNACGGKTLSEYVWKFS